MKKNYQRLINKKMGFTLLEILLVIAAIAILAGVVIVAINPGKQLAETRNAKRNSNVNTILNAVYQYSIDNNGIIPTSIPPIASGACGEAINEICPTDLGSCGSLVDLEVLTLNEEYLVSIPEDPQGPSGANPNGAGYHIVQTSNGRIEVCAPNAERGEVIKVRR